MSLASEMLPCDREAARRRSRRGDEHDAALTMSAAALSAPRRPWEAGVAPRARRPLRRRAKSPLREVLDVDPGERVVPDVATAEGAVLDLAAGDQRRRVRGPADGDEAAASASRRWSVEGAVSECMRARRRAAWFIAEPRRGDDPAPPRSRPRDDGGRVHPAPDAVPRASATSAAATTSRCGPRPAARSSSRPTPRRCARSSRAIPSSCAPARPTSCSRRCSARAARCCSTAPSTCATGACCCRRFTASACARTPTRCARSPSATSRRWPRGRAFSVIGSTQAITLEVIMRIVFGVEDRGRRDRLGARAAARARRRRVAPARARAAADRRALRGPAQPVGRASWRRAQTPTRLLREEIAAHRAAGGRRRRRPLAAARARATRTAPRSATTTSSTS